MLENEVFNRPYVRDITKTCECTCSVTCNPDIITNADRIRTMSDEDLACRNVHRVWITNSEYGWSEYITSDEERFEDYNVAIKHELEWLQKPAEED